MNSFEPQSQDSLQRRFHQDNSTTQQPRDTTTPFIPKPASKNHNNSNSSSGAAGRSFQGFGLNVEDDLVSSVVPPVTVVLEGRSICQRISLDKHGSYQSLASALRQMFVDGADSTDDLDLSNAIPGHLIAYEDMENDLLLAGDLTWKDFVRVAKRIRILPVKGNTRQVKRNE
ncbi:Auxin-responsive protein IAA33 [Arabidopsis thaliana]|uniref:Auxin-responsive protein IAA33 n=9 Tax=Arabidopsis TaxID=3701 RepID=IAA33_ARATH|nr:indole-3-acetic acid inducible 33 [Arabidopsis thaliana]Q9FKM7.1 RecName: Full=Auxin-responsive protein IAA33; AltName: Full=Indoleacetic acid-induced protein 33 [Arabidopsis thaliana]KAG7606419.1 AUX/IAA domain [Arabidopsis thaliana x Arabidopsis arenosa]KAG7613333.1 AUX/IAA domain [Arabidopsis suecica]AAT67088.1 IAA33 [Arabidopsis thaliana]ADB93688.2 indole-3-acetic acid inducible 33 [Arabidopsis thaliana]ADL70831.1 indole-3-acetic acid inducible 33 [Arabidopsis thaliana]|eukprot:NP_200552.1 indole-3-acetic acid inducible 33 [Arabidopsis thaliana]